MSVDLFTANAARPGPAAAESTPSSLGPDRERLKRIAAEFESMLLVQVLKDMRRAGSWQDESESDGMGMGMGMGTGFESLFEHIDVELASHLSRVQGLGLSKQLEQAFDRMHVTNPQLPTPNPQDHGGLGVGSWESGVDHAREPGHESNPIVSAVRAAADAAVSAPRTVANWVRPVAGAVTSAFGWRHDPFTDGVKFHKGVDLRAAYGQEVHAAGAGRVAFSGEQGGYGTTVVVEHEDGTRTRYAHLSARSVEKGDQVEAGGVLGRAGRSGRATGTHLHFEVIAADGTRIQPRVGIPSRIDGLPAD